MLSCLYLSLILKVKITKTRFYIEYVFASSKVTTLKRLQGFFYALSDIIFEN